MEKPKVVLIAVSWWPNFESHLDIVWFKPARITTIRDTRFLVEFV